MLRWLRRLIVLMIIAAIFAALAYVMIADEQSRARDIYNTRVTLAVDTAVAGALFDATRTAEASIPHYRVVVVSEDEALVDVAERYNTTVDVLRMANGLAVTVAFGDGRTELVVPENIIRLEPPRRLNIYRAIEGDTLERLALFYDVPLYLIQQDNPILVQRGIIPGDVVFIPAVL